MIEVGATSGIINRMGRSLNEKTLELNLCSELSRFFRLLGLQTVWRGLTQQEERKWGFDAATSLGGGRLIFIQWKAVNRVKRGGAYSFKLNDDQMLRLTQLGRKYPSSVFYGLPRVDDWSDYRTQGFLALPNTRFVDAGMMKNHPSLGKQLSHTATISPNGAVVRVTSKPMEYKALRIEEVFGSPPMEQLEAMLSGFPNFKFLRLQGPPSEGFLIADAIGPTIINLRGKVLEQLPKATSENFESAMNSLSGEGSSKGMSGLSVGLVFDLLGQK